MSLTPPTTGTDLDAWRSFRRAHAQVAAKVEADVLDAADLSLLQYEVLAFVVAEPVRMNAVADHVMLSPSGLTRVVDSLARRGYVTRERDGYDRRGVLLAILPAGRNLVDLCQVAVDESVDRWFTQALTARELAAVHNASAALLERISQAVPA